MKGWIVALGAIVVAGGVSACSNDGGGSTTAFISAANGGLIESPDAKMKVMVPPGAVSSDVTVTMKKVDTGSASPEVGSATFKGFAYQIEPALQLNGEADVSVKMSFTEADAAMNGGELTVPAIKLAGESMIDGTLQELASSNGAATSKQGVRANPATGEVTVSGPTAFLKTLLVSKAQAKVAVQPPPASVEGGIDFNAPTTLKLAATSGGSGGTSGGGFDGGADVVPVGSTGAPLGGPVQVSALVITSLSPNLQVGLGPAQPGSYGMQNRRTGTDINIEFTGGDVLTDLVASPPPTFRCLGGTDLPYEITWELQVTGGSDVEPIPVPFPVTIQGTVSCADSGIDAGIMPRGDGGTTMLTCPLQGTWSVPGNLDGSACGPDAGTAMDSLIVTITGTTITIQAVGLGITLDGTIDGSCAIDAAFSDVATFTGACNSADPLSAPCSGTLVFSGCPIPTTFTLGSDTPDAGVVRFDGGTGSFDAGGGGMPDASTGMPDAGSGPAPDAGGMVVTMDAGAPVGDAG